MNSNRRVFLFVAISVGLFFLLSIIDLCYNSGWTVFRRVNLLSDLVRSESHAEPNVPVKDSLQTTPLIAEIKATENFNLYKSPRLITDFKADTSLPALPFFSAKLHDLKNGKPVKVRIAYFGDSMIEGDLLTQTLRKLLQQSFGGNGVGFVPITSQVSQFRQTVRSNYSDSWEEENFKELKTQKIYLSGHTFFSNNAWVRLTDQTIRDSVSIEKSLICGNISKPINVQVNNKLFEITAPALVNRIVINNDPSHTVQLNVMNELLPVYGISFESQSGIFVDNFSFRGITGIEFARMDSMYLKSIAEQNPYDLIIFQYGVNLLFRPKDTDFSWYSKAMTPIIKKIKNCFRNSDFMLISTADRAFRYDGEYKSALGIDSLVKTQAIMAYKTGSSFYNQYASMGGAQSIVDWAAQTPPLANQDFVHPNARGAELLANYLFNSLIREYNEYLQTTKLTH